MNYGQLKAHALKLLDEYSSRGAIQSAIKTADISFKMQDLANDALYDLASTTAKIPAVYFIAHNPVYNELAKDTSSIKKHLPGTDFSIELVGAKSCFFEATGPATVLIEEYNSGAWSAIETIEIPATQISFAEYKRLITPTVPTNNVRLRFSGDYPYDFHNYVLYPYSWPTQDSVQQSRPHFIYSLPDDYLQLHNVMAKRDQRQYTPYNNYILSPDKKIAINRYEIGEYLINYWRKPSLLVFTGDEVVDNAQTLDISEDAARIAPYYVAGQVLMSEGELAKGVGLINQFESKKVSLVSNEGNYSASITNVFGW